MREVVYLPGVEPGAPPHRSAEEIDDILVRALARKALSEAEAAEILQTNGLPSDEIPEHIAEFVRRGYLNDHLLAEDLVERLISRKGFGKSHIERNLRERRIDPAAIAVAMEAVDSAHELERAREWAQKRAPQLRSLDPAVAERRLVGFLSRKGYSASLSLHVARESLRSSARVRFE